MKYTGADIVLKALKKLDVKDLFGYPGGAVIPLYDALYRTEGFNHYRTAHEQGAVHAADAYARATGKVGVCIATSGPGATNTITGIATAFSDSVPLVVITGQVPSPLLGRDSFQEIDITGITFQITKHNFIVKDVNDLESVMMHAFNIAKSGRPGPVLVDIPKDLFTKEVEYKNLEVKPFEKHENVKDASLKTVMKMIQEAKRPVIYAGGGVILGEASEELKKFAIKLDIPVVNTLMGLGNFPRDHELSLGLIGMHGFPEANLAIANSDLILAIGARFSDRVTGNKETFSASSKVIHIDVDKTEISKNITADYSVLGYMKDALTKLERSLDVRKNKKWKKEVESFRNEKLSTSHCDNFVPENIYGLINSYYNDDTVVSTDVGQHQMWTAQYWKFKKPRTFVTSGGLGTMGFGLGAAIGVSVSKRESVLITGDGSFRMNCNELATVAKYKIPLTIILINNNALGMVRQWQKMFQDERYAETCIDDEVDYVKLVQAYGIKGVKVESIKDLDDALKSKSSNEPLLIECKINKDENVLPIVPPGKSISNFILG